jgi:hypothetical protein
LVVVCGIFHVFEVVFTKPLFIDFETGIVFSLGTVFSEVLNLSVVVFSKVFTPVFSLSSSLFLVLSKGQLLLV